MLASISASVATGEPVDEVAFDLFSASMRSSHLADVRVVLLVMAVECLIERSDRPGATVQYVNDLVERTLSNKSSSLPSVRC